MNRRKFIKATGTASTILMLNPFRVFSTEDTDVENLIIGSGYGGAVTALRLTQAGHKVTMLEMGLDWENNEQAIKPYSNMLFPGKNSTWLSKKSKAPFLNIFRFSEKYTGILDRWDFDNLKVYMGRGVGGGSLVNGGTALAPKKSYFEELFPNLDSEEFYNKYFPLANKTLKITTIPEDYHKKSDYYKFSRVGVAEAEKAGYKTASLPNNYDFDYMQKEEAGEVPKSALDKEVIYGNNHGKNSLDKTYLKEARATGLLTVNDLHQVEDITQNEDGTYQVKVSIISTSGEVVAEKIFNAKRLFLSAGSIGTTKLLLKAKATGTLAKLDDTIGENWGNNGNIMSGRWFVNTIFNKVKTAEKDGRGTGTKQATIPVDGVDNWDDKERPFIAEIAPFPTGIEGYATLYLLINRVPKLGSFTYNPDSKYGIEPNWTKENYEHTIENTKAFLDRMIDANGGTYTGIFSNGMAPDICYHPLGGCVLGVSTDDYGRVNNYDNLYVTDGALIPGTAGANPYLTITALAEHNIEDILKNDIETDSGIAGRQVALKTPSTQTVAVHPTLASAGSQVKIVGAQIQSLQVFNNAGQLVFGKQNMGGVATYDLSTSQLSAGMHYVVINDSLPVKFIVR